MLQVGAPCICGEVDHNVYAHSAGGWHVLPAWLLEVSFCTGVPAFIPSRDPIHHLIWYAPSSVIVTWGSVF